MSAGDRKEGTVEYEYVGWEIYECADEECGWVREEIAYSGVFMSCPKCGEDYTGPPEYEIRDKEVE